MEIADWREQIDAIDEQLVALISRRAEAAQAIGAIKRQGARAIYEPDREQQVINHVCAINPGPIPDERMAFLFQRLMEVMRGMQTI